MTRHGTEVDTMILDELGSTVEVHDTLRDFNITTRFKRYSIRIKVKDKREEMMQYLEFTDLIDAKRKEDMLFTRDDDATTQPAFGLEYRKNISPEYYIIRRYCLKVL
jgi:hypothetical protein